MICRVIPSTVLASGSIFLYILLRHYSASSFIGYLGRENGHFSGHFNYNFIEHYRVVTFGELANIADFRHKIVTCCEIKLSPVKQCSIKSRIIDSVNFSTRANYKIVNRTWSFANDCCHRT